jgi:hypothetical protein
MKLKLQYVIELHQIGFSNIKKNIFILKTQYFVSFIYCEKLKYLRY